jgi:hypothetical protein
LLIGVAFAGTNLTNRLCVTTDYHCLVVASFCAEGRMPKVTIRRFWIDKNLIGVLYRINARHDPIGASEDGNTNQTPDPASDGTHGIPPVPDLNSEAKARSEVRRSEATFAAISQTFRALVIFLSSHRLINIRSLARRVPQLCRRRG